MKVVTVLLLPGEKDPLAVPDNTPRVVVSSLCDDCRVVD